MRRHILLLTAATSFALTAVLPSARLWSQQDRPILEEWREVLRYGIDSEVLKVIKNISKTGETSLNRELLDLFRDSLSFEVRKAVLEFFGREKIRDAEGLSRTLLGNSELDDPELTVLLIRYLREIESRDLEGLLIPLVDDRNEHVAEASINALGDVGTNVCGELLIQRLEDPDYPDSLKPEIILALGALRYREAVEKLLAIAANRDEERIWRLYAASALGEIGDERAIPQLKAMFAEPDSLVKIYAASALSKFDLGEVESLLQQGLRDANVRVRLASAKALASPQARDSVEILIYKARHDPEQQVRLQAIESLGVIGTRQAFEYLRELYRDRTALPGYREAALTALCTNDLGPSLETIRRVVEEEWDGKDRRIIELTARKLSTIEAGGLKGIFERLLGSPDVNVRIYALRGIEKNRLSSLRDKVQSVASDDPYPAARSIALSVLESL